MKKVDLGSKEYTEKFAQAPIYAKKALVKAAQITKDGLETGEYADKDVRFDEEEGCYVLDTYVMRETAVEGESGNVRRAELEDTRPVEAGEWIITNPKTRETDRANNYATPDKKFRKRYEPTEVPGIYRARGMARIIENDTGEAVEIVAPWGGLQNGDAKCYFCVPYSKDNPDDIAQNDRYILSENDFATYGLADEVLGAGWDR